MKAALSGSFDLIILDLILPDIPGKQLCRWLRETGQTAHLPILVVSGRADVDERVAALKAGANDYLTKPFVVAELAARVEAALRVKQLNDELADQNRRYQGLLTQMEEMARTDALTGLANRRRFEEALDSEFRRARRYNLPLACLLIDLDHFKEINDQGGHPAGDVALLAAARAIKSNIREVDLAARWGGDEFAVLLPQTALETAVLVARRILDTIRGLTLEGPKRRMTASLGIAGIPDPNLTGQEQIISVADLGLLAAKKNGRDRLEIARANRLAR